MTNLEFYFGFQKIVTLAVSHYPVDRKSNLYIYLIEVKILFTNFIYIYIVQLTVYNYRTVIHRRNISFPHFT